MDTTQAHADKVRYVVCTWVPEDQLAAWNEWHTGEHVPAVVAAPQIQRARKYEVSDSTLPLDWQPQYVTVYELDSLADMAAYLQGPGVRLREEYAARYGSVGKIARMILHEEARFDPVE